MGGNKNLEGGVIENDKGREREFIKDGKEIIRSCLGGMEYEK